VRGHARVSLSRSRLTRYLTLTRYLIEALAVVLHMCVAFVPQLLLIYYALAMQHTWAVLMCPAGGIDGLAPLLWTDVVPHSFRAFSLSGTEERYSLLLLRLVAWESILFMLLSACRLLLNYMQAPRNKMSDAIRWLYSIVIMLHLTWFFSYLGIICCWLLLAAILNPNSYLPFGCAVLVVVVVATTIGRQMLEAAARLKDMLWKAFSAVLQAHAHAHAHAQAHAHAHAHMHMRIHTNVHRSADQDARGNGQDRKEAPRRSDGEGGAAGLVGRAGRGPTAQAREEGGCHPAGHLHGNQHGRLRHAQDG